MVDYGEEKGHFVHPLIKITTKKNPKKYGWRGLLVQEWIWLQNEDDNYTNKHKGILWADMHNEFILLATLTDTTPKAQCQNGTKTMKHMAGWQHIIDPVYGSRGIWAFVTGKCTFLLVAWKRHIHFKYALSLCRIAVIVVCSFLFIIAFLNRWRVIQQEDRTDVFSLHCHLMVTKNQFYNDVIQSSLYPIGLCFWTGVAQITSCFTISNFQETGNVSRDYEKVPVLTHLHCLDQNERTTLQESI